MLRIPERVQDVPWLDLPPRVASGLEAARLATGAAPASRADDPISRISHEAIDYAAALPITDARLLSSRLYRYNTTPCSDDLRAAFGGNAQVAGMLGLNGSSAQLQRLAGSGYERVDHIHWHAWTRRTFIDAGTFNSLRYKLYVSPNPRAIVHVFEQTLKVAVELQVPSFKIGKSIGNLLRPDKLILYTDSASALDIVTTELKGVLAPHPAQGVPFTKCLDATGMLSAGADPPRSLDPSDPAQAESWRAWITHRLALAILQARAVSSDPSMHRELVLTRLSLEGIDTREWTPCPQLWQGEPS